MKSPWQQRFFGWYVIALAAGLVGVVAWIIFQIHQINREMQRAEDKAGLLAHELDPVLRMSDIYQELATELPAALPRLQAAVDALGKSRQGSAREEYRRERQSLALLLERSVKEAPQAHVIARLPVQLDIKPRETLQKAQQTFEDYCNAVEEFADELDGAAGSYRDLPAYTKVEQQYQKLKEIVAEIDQQHDFVASLAYAAGDWFSQTGDFSRRFSRLILWLAVTVLLALGALTHLGYLSLIRSLKRQVIESRSQPSMDRFGRLATTLAHEIRNPLTAINVRLFTLQRGLKAGSNEHEDATIIRREIDRLNRYLKEFLQFARPSESNRLPLTAEPLLNEVRALLAAELAEREIELRVVIEQDGTFRGDPDKLKQVLINLVKNGTESIGRRGRMTLRASTTRHRFSDQPAAMLIEVSDNGPGIASEIADQVFAPFYSTKQAGTGLGLPTAAQIVTEHGGRLEFRSPPAGGTTFCIWLPLTER